jgi:hypothetical protein
LNKTALLEFLFVLLPFAKNLKFNLGGDRFSDEQSSKNGDLSHILEKI